LVFYWLHLTIRSAETVARGSSAGAKKLARLVSEPELTAVVASLERLVAAKSSASSSASFSSSVSASVSASAAGSVSTASAADSLARALAPLSTAQRTGIASYTESTTASLHRCLCNISFSPAHNQPLYPRFGMNMLLLPQESM
jgi:hypothetical protein